MAMSEPIVSLCMIAKNESHVLARCLESVHGVVDEIIVVDTGSTDATPQVAAAYGAQVIHEVWRNDFAQARNRSLERARGDWILVLDADEELAPESRPLLKPRLAATAAEGLQVCVRSFLPAGDLLSYDDLYLTRLFRNRPAYRYEQPIHEQIRPAIERAGGIVAVSDLLILHYGYAQQTAQGQDRRALRNLAILERALEASPNDPYLYYQLGVTYQALGQSQRAAEALHKALTLDRATMGDAALDRLHMRLAQLALAADQYGDAIAHARASLTRNPDNFVSLYVLALAHMLAGHIEQAYRCFRRLRQLPNARPETLSDLDSVIAYCRSALGEGGA